MTAVATPVRERPILFSGEMVRAILEGRKTQTRRVVRPQPASGVRRSPFVPSGLEDGHGREIRPTYGQPGDRLWVRETWGVLGHVPISLRGPGMSPRHLRYRADWPAVTPGNTGWKPSIHMPRWASRITIEIIGVRIERVQEMPPEDFEAEGMVSGYSMCELDARYSSLSRQFRDLWDSLNAKRGYGWDANPWVWVIEFKRVPPLSERAAPTIGDRA